MSRLLLLAVPLMSGCAWLGARGRDAGDIVRVEGSFGVGLQANVNVGELAHLGLGSSRRRTAGWAYGFATSERRVEDHLPLSFVHSLIEPGAEALHSLELGEKDNPQKHRCAAVAPCTIEEGSITKPPLQFWNLEVGVMALFLGAEVGVNPAEFVDFLLGIFGLDIAGDDEEDARSRRRLWVPSSPDLRSDW